MHGDSWLLRRYPTLGFAVLALLAVIARATPVLAPVQALLLDSQHQLLARAFPKQAAREVVVVGIDDDAMRAHPEPLALWHPHFGKFLRAVAAARPAAVGLDVVLPDRSFDVIVPGYDRQLLQGLAALRRSRSLVIALTADASGAVRPIHPPFVSVAGADALAHVLLPFDADQKIRRASGALGDPGAAVPSFAAAMAARMSVQAHEGYIDYAFAPLRSYVPLRQVLAWHDAADEASLRAAFEGRAVLLGSVLPLEDRHFQPVNLAAWEPENGKYVPGVLIHAQILRGMLNGGLITAAPNELVALLCAALALLWFVRARLATAAAVAILGCLALYVASAALLQGGLYVPVAPAMATVAAAVLGRWLVESLFELRERARLRRAFSGYVSPAIMDEILRGELGDALGGKLRTVCIMFADVRGFTTFSETMRPEAVIGLLNRYFELVMAAIHAEGGTINSIMGDGLMAIFGAPKALDHPCDRAVAAARGMIDAVETLNAQLRAEGRPEVAIGIGLNYGDAVIGHVGSAARHDYSAIGDTTNLAARVEGLTRTIGFPLACTEAVVRELQDPTGFVSAGMQSVKGRSAVRVYGCTPGAGVAPTHVGTLAEDCARPVGP